MRQNPTDDELLRSYLLGELPDPEADHLERRLLAEDDLFDLAEALEGELLAAASRGELAPAERERVLRRLASSPEGRERLALARSLNTMADEKKPSVVPFRPRAASSKPVVQWAALAAGLFAAAGLFWFTQQTPQEGDSAPQIVQERTAPARPSPQKRPAPPVISAPATPEPSPAPAPLARKEQDAAVQRPEPVKAIFVLSLASLRGGEEREEFFLPSNADIAEIQVDVEGLEDSSAFHAALHGEDGENIWEESGLKAQRVDWGTALVLEIPAKLLTSGRYEVAVTTDSEPEMTQELEIVREDR